jgi:dimethylargininase
MAEPGVPESRHRDLSGRLEGVFVENTIAITRGVSPGFASCELTHLSRQSINLAVAEEQHCAYEALLAKLGVNVQRLPADATFPDSVFVEDTAVVLDELAIIMRPGSASRRGETDSITGALRPFRQLQYIDEPGTIDGGDVLQIGCEIFVGESTRTNEAAIAQLQGFLEPHGYNVVVVPVRGALHLKSGVTAVTDEIVLINCDWVDASAFADYQLINVDPAEPSGANVLRVGDAVVYAAEFPATRKRLEAEGIRPKIIEVSELAKAEGALTCCSLLFERRG